MPDHTVNMQQTGMAVWDRFLYEAAMTKFYGSLTFQFKAGMVVLVRREETYRVDPPTRTDELTGAENHSEGRDGSHERVSFEHPR